jgi:hypothetical protein
MTPELTISQQAKSEAEELDDWHKLPKKEVALDKEVSTSYSSEINDLRRALESRLSLSEQPSTTADRARASTIRRTYESSIVRDNARTHFSHASEDDSSHHNFIEITATGHARAHFGNAYGDYRNHYSFTTRDGASAHFGQDLGDENLVQCFVDGCGTKKPYMSVLL